MNPRGDPQEIDLYRADLDLRRELPLYGRVLLILALSVALGASLWLVNYFEVQRLTGELAEARALHTQTETRVAELQALWDSPEIAQAEAQARLAEQRRARLAEAAELLQSRIRSGSEHPPADPLEILARSHHPEVWITGVALEAERGTLMIHGRTQSADALPDYLATLESHGLSSLGGHPELEARADPENGVLDFTYRLVREAP
ncbi:MAG: hypothetical protein ACQETK_06865 [Pseudomonadota bacterium]